MSRGDDARKRAQRALACVSFPADGDLARIEVLPHGNVMWAQDGTVYVEAVLVLAPDSKKEDADASEV